MDLVQFAAHTAYLDPMYGTGRLVRPRAEDDIGPLEGVDPRRIWLPNCDEYATVPELSLHWADWESAVQELYHRGWEVLEDDDGDMLVSGTSEDGRVAIGLYTKSIIGDPDWLEIEAAIRELCAAADVRPR
ncbi:hypothetical protein ACFCV3_02080 [Kribbella sp. NPDC056345]|uniref:hypothetical protein n=1 Tax=Kribbella sp. NPDC056345 TaxID=3345789 RepID=UPI0035D9CA1F